MSNLIAWIIRAIPFGTIIMFGSMGEITTEKSGNLNLGVPGIMYLGGFAGFASSYFYEKNLLKLLPKNLVRKLKTEPNFVDKLCTEITFSGKLL